MMVLPEEYIGSICELKTYDNDLLSASRIARIGDDYIEVLPPEKEERLPLLQYQFPVKLAIINSRKGFRMLAGQVFISTNEFMRITDVDTLQNSERRGYFRMRVKGTGGLYPPGVEEHQLNAHQPQKVDLEDVSLSGIQISTLEVMEQGQEYTLDFTLLSRRMLLGVRVMRLCKVVDGKRYYGLAFTDLNNRQSDRLCKDIFELQRQQIAKRKSMVY